MEQSLTTGALALGVISWVCGLLAARAQAGDAHKSTNEAPHIAPAYWAFALGAPLLFWLFTLPDAPPFGLGHASGNGALLGGVVAVIGVYALLKAVNWNSDVSR